MTHRYFVNGAAELAIADEVHPAGLPMVVCSEEPATPEQDLGALMSRWLEEAARVGAQPQAGPPPQVVVVASATAPRPRFYRD